MALSKEADQTLSHLAGMPRFAKPTVTRDVLRELLLYTDGWMMAQGVSFNLKPKHLGAGIYELRLEPRHP